LERRRKREESNADVGSEVAIVDAVPDVRALVMMRPQPGPKSRVR
jgi:hypothetical protein